MINKQNLWFTTLFAIVLALGIYYVSMDEEFVSVIKSEGTNKEQQVLEIDESDVLVSLEVEDDEEKQALMEDYQEVLLDNSATSEEKNVAYESMQELNNNIGMEEKIKSKIKETYKLNSFIKIKDNAISITIASKEHSASDANKIIRTVQEMYTESMYITIKYQQ